MSTFTKFSESNVFYNPIFKGIGQALPGLEADIVFNDANCSSPSGFVACTENSDTSLEVTNNGDASDNCCLGFNLEEVMQPGEVGKIGDNWSMESGATGVLAVTMHWAEEYFNENYPDGYSGTMTYYVGWCEETVIHVTDSIAFEITISPSGGVVCSDYTTQQTCEDAGCYWWSTNTCHSTEEPAGCEQYLDQTACEDNNCFWYPMPPWDPPSCHNQDILMAYLPFIAMGVGGVIVVAALVIGSKKQKGAAWAGHPAYYPPSQR